MKIRIIGADLAILFITFFLLSQLIKEHVLSIQMILLGIVLCIRIFTLGHVIYGHRKSKTPLV